MLTGIFIWILPDTNLLEYGYATLDQLFEVGPWVFIFLIPAITMRFFAEERRSGTIEIITTKPITDWAIVGGKYLAGLALVIFALLPTLLYFYTVYNLATPTGNMDLGGTWGSYLGLFFLGGCYVAMGIFASSVTDNQIISFIFGSFLCFLFYALLEWLRSYTTYSGLDVGLEWINLQSHYISISRGVLDTRDLIFFVSFIVLFLLFTKLKLESRKW